MKHLISTLNITVALVIIGCGSLFSAEGTCYEEGDDCPLGPSIQIGDWRLGCIEKFFPHAPVLVEIGFYLKPNEKCGRLGLFNVVTGQLIISPLKCSIGVLNFDRECPEFAVER